MTMDDSCFLGFKEDWLNSVVGRLSYYFVHARHENFPSVEVSDLIRVLGQVNIYSLCEDRKAFEYSNIPVTFTKGYLEDLYASLNAIWWKSKYNQGPLRDQLEPVLNWLSHTAEIPAESPLHASDYLANGTEPSVAEDDKEALRYNEGKTPYQYLPMDLLAGAANVMEKGCEKYGKANYRKGYSDIGSPLASLMRHVAELQRSFELDDKGLGFDSESGFHHADHVITSALLLIQTLKLKGLYTK